MQRDVQIIIRGQAGYLAYVMLLTHKFIQRQERHHFVARFKKRLCLTWSFRRSFRRRAGDCVDVTVQNDDVEAVYEDCVVSRATVQSVCSNVDGEYVQTACPVYVGDAALSASKVSLSASGDDVTAQSNVVDVADKPLYAIHKRARVQYVAAAERMKRLYDAHHRGTIYNFETDDAVAVSFLSQISWRLICAVCHEECFMFMNVSGNDTN